MDSNGPVTPHKSTNVRSLPWSLRLARSLVPLAYKVVPRTIEKLAVSQFRSPRSHPRPGREERWLATAERIPIGIQPVAGADADASHQLAAWSWGDGPAVLLVHGWEGRGSQMGAFAAPLVQAGYRVVTFDAPAHGETGGRLSSLPEMTHAVTTMAQAVGPLHGLIAHSFGCAAAALAVERGLRLERLVFVAPPADFGGFLLCTVRSFGLPDRVYDLLTRAIESRFGISWEGVRRITLDAANETPLLVAHDRGDPETTYEGGLQVHRAWPRSRLLTTDGLGHRRILRDPEVAAKVAQFLSGKWEPDLELPSLDLAPAPLLRAGVECVRVSDR